mgnify:FL=1
MGAVTYVISHAVFYFIEALQFAMIIRALLSWFPLDDDNIIVSFVYSVTEPFIYPVRLLLEKSDRISSLPIDVSFFVTYLILFAVSTLLSIYGGI